MWKIYCPQNSHNYAGNNKLAESFPQLGLQKILYFFVFRIKSRFIREITANKEKQRHVCLGYKFENKGTINISDAHCDNMPHHYKKYSYTLYYVEIAKSLRHSEKYIISYILQR